MDQNFMNAFVAHQLTSENNSNNSMNELLFLMNGSKSKENVIRFKYLTFKKGLKSVSGLDEEQQKVLRNLFALALKENLTIEEILKVIMSSGFKKVDIESDEFNGIRGFAKRLIRSNDVNDLYNIYSYVSYDNSFDDDLTFLL